MLTRRRFAAQAGSLAAGTFLGARPVSARRRSTGSPWYMPDEAAPHARTWMAFGASERIWGHRLLPEVRRNLAAIATAVSRHEPVSMLVRSHEVALARALVGPDVELVESPLDDLWVRDTGPTFVVDGEGSKAAVDFNFNGWGGKQAHARDAEVAALVADRAGVPTLETDLVLEGGCIEVDGHGSAIITESCVLNDNRNPGVTRSELERGLMPLLGLEKIVWLPGVRGKDITDGHTDFYARFARPGVVVAGYDPDPASYDHAVTARHLELLRAATDAQGRALEVLVLEAPTRVSERYDSDDFAAGYIGYYVCNGAVLVQAFGDRHADRAARETLSRAFPDRVVESIAVDAIAAGGGSIHCATQQEPRA